MHVVLRVIFDHILQLLRFDWDNKSRRAPIVSEGVTLAG
jgi:hypothetical protein